MQCLGACGICVPSLLTVRLAFRETGALGVPREPPAAEIAGPGGPTCGWWLPAAPGGSEGDFLTVSSTELTGISYKEKPSLVKDPLTLKRTITFNSLFITF